jgi:putative ATP-binding cassette transporter
MKWRARALLFLLLGFSLTVSFINVRISYIGRDFWDAFHMRVADRFYSELIVYILAFAVAAGVVALYRYTEERLALFWRRWLSLKLLSLYFANRAYYRIATENLVDNPDQRIVEDIRSFTAQSLSFLLILLNAVISLSLFITVLWSISKVLTLVAVGYAAIGSCLSYLLGRQLISLNFIQLQREADYRYKLVNIRDNVESISFYHGERKEKTRSRQKINKAIENLRLIINRNRNLNFFTNFYNYLIPVLPTIIVAPLYFDEKITFGEVTQANIAFAQTLGALSIIVTNFGSLSAFGAVINRLGTFYEAVVQAEQRKLRQSGTIRYAKSNFIGFEGVTIMPPVGTTEIVRNLSLRLNINERLLIVGPSGSGKSSVLRALSGMWDNGSGLVTRPALKTMLFLPQRSYLILGSMRNQLLYLQRRRGIGPQLISEAIALARLTPTIERVGGLDVELDWANVLSMGEQQRVAFARLFLSGVNFACLDEATTAIDPHTQIELYQALQSRVKGYISIGNPDVVGRFHDWMLELHGDGTWSLTKLNQ